MQAPDVDRIYEPDGLELDALDEDIAPKLDIEWEPEDKEQLSVIMGSLDRMMRGQYAQAFAVEKKLLDQVRTPIPSNAGGGWLMNPDGSYVEDWSRITIPDMEKFIQEASSWTFFSSQQVIDSYAEAVFAKFTYDDSYDDAYSSQLTGTIGDKQAKAKRRTKKERWLALYKTLAFKKSKEIIDRLEQHVRRVERIYTERQKQEEREFRAGRA
mgnify:CR=1 FL=1